MLSDYHAAGAIIGGVLFVLALFHMVVSDEPFGVKNPDQPATLRQLAAVAATSAACVKLWPALILFGIGAAVVLPLRNRKEAPAQADDWSTAW